jgi:hypothetical protein
MRTVLIKYDWLLLATKSNAPVIGTLGGGRNALFIYPKDNIIVVILTNLMGGHPRFY